MTTFLKTFIAIIGYTLASGLTYFSFYPIKIEEHNLIKLTEIYKECEKHTSKDYTVEDVINDDNFISTEETEGIILPSNQLKELVKNAQNIAQYWNGSININLQACVLKEFNPDNSKQDALNYFKAKGNLYHVGDAGSYAVSINELPFLQLANIKVNVNSLFARTSMCLTPLNKMALHIFMWPGANEIKAHRVILITLSFKKNEVSSRLSQITNHLGNIIEAVHYFKYKINCNG